MAFLDGSAPATDNVARDKTILHKRTERLLNIWSA
jgi:hypothetical protein